VAALTVMAGLGVARGERRRVRTLGLVALAVPTALICAAMITPGLDRRLTAELPAVAPQPPPRDRASTTQPTRTDYWLAAGNMLRDYPWLGVGPDNYRWRFASYAGVPADNLGIHAHDQYIEALADTGVLGLSTFGWLLLTLVRTAFEGVRSEVRDWPWRAALLASLTAWLLHALLDDFERFWPANVAFWLIAGLTLCPASLGKNSAVEEPENGADDDDHDEQHQDAAWARQGGTRSATTAKADHRRDCPPPPYLDSSGDFTRASP
jgi:O-antigen ligase